MDEGNGGRAMRRVRSETNMSAFDANLNSPMASGEPAWLFSGIQHFKAFQIHRLALSFLQQGCSFQPRPLLRDVVAS